MANESETQEQYLAILENELSEQAAAYEKLCATVNCSPPESGVSINLSFTATTAGITVTGGQLTLRGDKHTDALEVLGTLAHIIQEKKWKFSTAPMQAPPPAENKAVEIVRESGNAVALAEVKKAAERVPDPPIGKTWLTLEVARVVIKPEPGDLTTIEFYASGHKWPDLKANKFKTERAAGLLRHVTSADVSKAADMTLTCVVYFVNGNEKKDKPGEYWKDVHHVRPL